MSSGPRILVSSLGSIESALELLLNDPVSQANCVGLLVDPTGQSDLDLDPDLSSGSMYRFILSIYISFSFYPDPNSLMKKSYYLIGIVE